MLKPCTVDQLKNRRLLAFVAAFHGFFVWPYIVAIMNKHGISDELCANMLTYMEIMSCGPMGAYFIAAHTNTKSGKMSMKDFAASIGNSAVDMVSSRVGGKLPDIPGVEGNAVVPKPGDL